MLRLSSRVISCPHFPTGLLHTSSVCSALAYRSIYGFASCKLGHNTRTKVACHAAYYYSSFLVWAILIHLTFSQAVCKKYTLQFLDLFAKLWKANISFVMSDSRSDCQSDCLSTWNNSSPNGWILINFDIWWFQKFITKFQVWMKSDTNNGYFTWRAMYVCSNISLNSSKNEKSFRQNL